MYESKFGARRDSSSQFGLVGYVNYKIGGGYVS